MKNFSRFLICILILSMTIGVCFEMQSFAAADFPRKAITLIVPWNPGGANDVAARALQPIFKEKSGVDLVIKNVPGGGSAVGITEAIMSKNDGYTLGFATSSFISLAAQDIVEVDLNTLENICMVMEDPIAVVCKTGKYGSLDDLVKDMKARPGEVICAISGTNNPAHVFTVLFGQAVGAELLLISQHSGARCVTDILGGHADISISNYGDFVSQIQAGEMKVLGVMTQERLKMLPEVPTVIESGYNVFAKGVLRQFSFVMGPSNLDVSVKDRLVKLFSESVADERFQSFAKERSFSASGLSGQELNKAIGSTYDAMKIAAAEIFTK